MANEKDIVVDDGRAKWSDLWLKEDYWAIWVGFFIILIAGLIMINGRSGIEADLAKYNGIIQAEKAKPIKTIELIQAQAAKKGVAGNKLPAAKTLIGYLATPGKWTDNPLDSFVKKANEAAKPAADEAAAKAKAALETAKAAQGAAAAASFGNAELNKAAESAIAEWQKANDAAAKAKAKVGSDKNIIPGLILLGLALGVILSVGMAAMGQPVGKFFIGFLGVYALCVFATFLGKYGPTSKYGLNAEIMSIVVGL
ncbi:MAG: putative sulfate exporter family transporter, partial [Mailhella sp.]|nr:putative sulfate exporter family transporter [Mailhella sp.]